MGYIVLSDLNRVITETELVQLTDDEGTGVVNTARVDEVISMADATIDSYIGGRYTVPLPAPAPEAIKTASVSIAVYFLCMRTGFSEISEKRKRAYDDTISLLKDISRGMATLGIEETTQERENAASNKPANDRVFTNSSLRDF